MLLPNGHVLGVKPERETVFRVLIAYADFALGEQAGSVGEFLRRQLEDRCGFEVRFLKFKLLRNPKLNSSAVADAVGAEVIIIAVRQNEELPREVRDWIDAWIPQKCGQAATLVALLEVAGNPGSFSAALVQLQRAASRAGLGFVVQLIPPAESDTAFVTWQETASATVHEGWGIND